MDKYERLISKFRKLAELERFTVLVGWIDGNNTARIAYENLQSVKKSGKPAKSPGLPPSNALIARTLNYGRLAGTTAQGRKYPEIPARPFMKFAKEGFDAIREKIIARNVPLVLAGKMSVERFAKFIGAAYKDEVTRAIRDSSRYPSPSDATIKARRRHGSSSSVPLIDTHQLVDSVSFEVK